MSTKVLANTVILGTTKFWPGTSLDTVSEAATIAALQGMGGKLYDSTDPGISEAAANCAAIRSRGGNEEACENAMNAAIDDAQQAAIAGASTVDDTTATNQGTGTGASVDVKNLASTIAYAGSQLPAAGVVVHVQDPGGAPLNLVAGFVNPLPRRDLVLTRGPGGPPIVNYTVSMTFADGSSSDIGVPVGPGASASTGFAGEVTAITSDVDPGDTTDMQTGDAFNLGNLFTGTPKIGVDSVEEAPAFAHGGTGTILPTSVPNGAVAYAVAYVEAHDHGFTDPGHNHLQDPHDHTLS